MYRKIASGVRSASCTPSPCCEPVLSQDARDAPFSLSASPSDLGGSARSASHPTITIDTIVTIYTITCVHTHMYLPERFMSSRSPASVATGTHRLEGMHTSTPWSVT